MSQIDFKNYLARLVAQMRGAGYSIPEIIALVIGDMPKAPVAPVASPEPTRMLAVENPNGTTRMVPWSPELQAQLDREAKAKARPTPAPKSVAPPHELVFAQSRGTTTHDAQVASYQEPWTGPSAAAEIDESEDVDFDALILEAERDLEKMRALRGKQ